MPGHSIAQRSASADYRYLEGHRCHVAIGAPLSAALKSEVYRMSHRENTHPSHQTIAAPPDLYEGNDIRNSAIHRASDQNDLPKWMAPKIRLSPIEILQSN
jgi:hypothetical protein